MLQDLACRPAEHRSVGRLVLTVKPAFSLIEMLLVVAIMAVTGMIAIPRVSRSDEVARLQAAARRIATEIETLRRQARATSSGMSIKADTETDEFGSIPLSQSPYRVEISDISLGPKNTVAFDAFGHADSQGEITLCTRHYEITVAVSGSISAIEARR